MLKNDASDLRPQLEIRIRDLKTKISYGAPPPMTTDL